jgi:hypothetical protein
MTDPRDHHHATDAAARTDSLDSEAAFGRAMAALLDDSAAGLRQGTVNRLATARREALDRWHPSPEPVWGMAWAAGMGARIATSRYFQIRFLAPLALLFLAVAGAGYWQATTNDLADIDAALLSSDLPIDAYLDQGFDQWLKRPAQ